MKNTILVLISLLFSANAAHAGKTFNCFYFNKRSEISKDYICFERNTLRPLPYEATKLLLVDIDAGGQVVPGSAYIQNLVVEPGPRPYKNFERYTIEVGQGQRPFYAGNGKQLKQLSFEVDDGYHIQVIFGNPTGWDREEENIVVERVNNPQELTRLYKVYNNL